MHRISRLPGLRFRLIPLVLQVLLLTGLTAQAQPDPRDDPALQQIVRLCATEPGSSRFDGAWTAWVADHPDADLEAVVASVVSRAFTLRSMAAAGLAPQRPGSAPNREQVAHHMRRLARLADS
jgi:hypothetical protein